MSSSYTPLRYPGGKTKLFSLFSELVSINQLSSSSCTYIEPFAGGAGLALKLLLENIVDKIVINDYDYAIYCIWDAILNRAEEICEFIENVPLSVTEWHRQKEIYSNQGHHTRGEIGKAAFFLNRTNVSGVLTGGVIGGISQEGKYKIDARFNRQYLIKIIQTITKSRSRIDLYNWDAKDFITHIIPNYNDCFVYLDPPYVKKGHYLYKNFFNENEHVLLEQVISTCPEKWIVTYDNCELIRKIYGNYYYEILSVSYSVGRMKRGEEVIIYGPGVIRKVMGSK